MTVALMQPRLFPYIAYWQLVGMVDKFIIYDNTNYTKKSYTNKNYIIINNEKRLVTLPLIGASQNKFFNEIKIGNEKEKFLITIDHAYKKAPYFDVAFPVIEKILRYEEDNLAYFIGNSIQEISKYLGFDTKFDYSSHLLNDTSFSRVDKVIRICQLAHAKTLINPESGEALYDRNYFKERGITYLSYRSYMDSIQYKQFPKVKEFIPNLSIIDVMMFNPKEDIATMMQAYEIF